ncbi:MAG TPA: chloride channel protein [Candidatus Acidoferrales bacterium]|nr:chloride channel protein [Candidatus Acidoferrales bacterium]
MATAVRGSHIFLPRYVETDKGYALYFGRVHVSQSTFMLCAAVIIGVGGGYGAVIFRHMIDAAGYLAFDLIGGRLLGHLGFLAILVVPIIGGIATSLIVTRFASEARGHGVPEVMEAVALRAGRMRPRIIAVKSVASAICIGFGGSCGREGPIVQIGSTIGSLLGQLGRVPAPITRTLVACGAASGISATFNAPIGGVFFASEVILGEFAPRSFAAIVIASVVSAVVGRAYFGNHPSFTAAAFNLVSPAELFFYAILGVICAFWAAGFVKLLYAVEDRFDALNVPGWVKAAIGFGALGVIGLWRPQIFGVGYEAIDQVLRSHVPPSQALLLAALKPIATSLTLGSGGSGGVFSPSLFTGAMLGDAFGRVVHTLAPTWTATGAAYGLVGMAAVFSAAAEAPITAIMIVFEMSNDYLIVLPLMVATVIATIIGRRLIRGTVYELKLIRRGINWEAARHPRLLTRRNVASIQRELPPVGYAGEPLSEIAKRISTSAEGAIPVLRDGHCIGIVPFPDFIEHLRSEPHAPIDSIARPTETLVPEDSFERAATLLADPGIAALPVSDPTTGNFIGMITRRDVLEAYRSAVQL